MKSCMVAENQRTKINSSDQFESLFLKMVDFFKLEFLIKNS